MDVETRRWLFATLFFAAVSAIFVAPGFLPRRLMVPLDLPKDSGAWKSDALARVTVSNRLLSDPVLEQFAWDREARRLLASGEIPWRNRFAGDGAGVLRQAEV